MSRSILVTAALFVLLAVALITYKVVALGYEPFPRPAPDRWSVQIEIDAGETSEDARLVFLLPADGPLQKIYDERMSAEGLRFFIRPRGSNNRVGVAVGTTEGVGRISYRFSVQTRQAPDGELPEVLPALAPNEERQLATLLATEETIQVDAELVERILEELDISREDRATALREIHEFVTKDIETTDGKDGPQDALSVLGRERGGSQGKARAAVALLRAVGIPARVVAGVRLVDAGPTDVIHWVEARLDGRFWPMDPVSGALGHLPDERLVLFEGDHPTVDARGVERANYHLSMLRERETQFQIYQRRIANSDRLLDRLSLYSLPVRTQMLYRVLLLVPLGVVLVAFFRNMIGVPSFGTFMPILLSLAFRESGLFWGLLLLAIVVGVGWVGRYLLDKAHLLMVPRLGFLLTLVILIIAGLMVVGENFGFTRAFTMAIFPLVIVTMTIERLSIAIIEEGVRNAAKQVAGTLAISITGTFVLSSQLLQHFVFTFPEVHLVTLAVLLLMGRYTGYRLSEWLRFRSFSRLGTGGAG